MNKKEYKLILASNSPRRKELLSGLNKSITIRIKNDIDESYPSTLSALDVPEYLSKKKASNYEVADDEILITADTLVMVNNIILGKPKDEKEAFDMLRLLSNKTHTVATGVCLKTFNKSISFTDVTEVCFKELSDEEINYYVSQFKPFDKAGSYGIQEWIGYIGITSIKGSYFNVMGLPLHRVYENIQELEGNN